MNRALSFVRLDCLTVKPYVTAKNLFVFVAISLIMAYSTGAFASAIGILMVYAALYVSYPFAVCEKNGMDALYATLSISRRTVVTGRYLFALGVNTLFGALFYAVSSAMLMALRKPFDALESLVVTLAIFFICSLLQAIQLPIYFRLGYAKAKFIAYLPLFGLSLGGIVVSNVLKSAALANRIEGALEWFAANPLVAAIWAVAFWLAAILLSHRLSVAHYGKRDF